MKKHLIYLLLLIFIGFSSGCKSEKQKIKEQNEIVEKTIGLFEKKLLKQQIDSVFTKYNFNGVVAVYRDSVPVYLKSNGYASFKEKTKLDSLTVFGIASNSKQFTAVMILRLMEDGKLKTGDKVSQYLDEFKRPDYENITIQQLLNHTSGLNNLGGKLMFESGSDFHYSNEGFNALGRIIEKISGKPYEENAAELFKLAGMQHTFTNKDFQSKNFGGAWVGKLTSPEEVANMPDRLAEKGIGNPAGGILSTVGDLNIWNQKLFGGKILKPETLAVMTKKTATRTKHFFAEVGYGDGIMMYGDAPLAYFHTGYVKGLPSVNIYYPSTRTSVIVLSNFADESNNKKVIFAPHADIRLITDGVESTVAEMRKELIIDPEKKK